MKVDVEPTAQCVPQNFHVISSCDDAETLCAYAPSNAEAFGLPPRIHFVWVGSEPPRNVLLRMMTWAGLNPLFEVIVWGSDALAELAAADAAGIEEALYLVCPNAAATSDVARFAILRRFGGVYLDADMEASRPITPLLEYGNGFVVRESRSLVVAGALGLPPASAFASVALRVMNTAANRHGELNNFISGPPLITELCRSFRSSGLSAPSVLPDWTFFPENPFRFPRRRRGPVPPFGIHLYEHSWSEGSELRRSRRLARAVAQIVLPQDTPFGRRRRLQRQIGTYAMEVLRSYDASSQ